MANVIRICLADDCNCMTRFGQCTSEDHLQSWNGYKTYPVMSQSELEASARRFERLGWLELEKRRRAKIKRLKARQNGED